MKQQKEILQNININKNDKENLQKKIHKNKQPLKKKNLRKSIMRVMKVALTQLQAELTSGKISIPKTISKMQLLFQPTTQNKKKI